MFSKVSFFLPFIATLLPQALGLYVPEQHANHSVTVNAEHLVKRFDNARFTFYDAGLGACGKTNSNSDFIVALNAPQWNGGNNCWKMITISYGGKTAQAQVTDLCPSCDWGMLDLSRGLFDHFASEDLGVIHGQWWFNEGGDNNSGGNDNGADHDQQATEPPKTTTTDAPPPPPTTTSSPPPPPPPPATTSTPPPPTTTTTSASSSASSSSSATSSTALSAPTPAAIDGAIEHLMLALGQLGELVAAGASVTA
ncbi:expansin family protein [Moniliophthora roreri MCA 2997]|uniref:Expansin family protein n=2 Tax=Moniliophthora roreri TaxID=221103 RepID=V2YMU7_MONRO|nr:expansin family protein [Moniliophthora roreri MCA 2997]KAI3610624.1 expansin family protein [Moniliophthora roreri]